MGETNRAELLFDISPIEDEDSKKKRASKRRKKKPDEPKFESRPVNYSEGFVPGYVASIEGHLTCHRCGTDIIDLAEVVRRGGRTFWIVVCGWSCGLSWSVDPIPGVLADKKTDDSTVLRSGLFKGKTLEEVWAAGETWYVEELSRGKRPESKAAAEFLKKKIG